MAGRVAVLEEPVTIIEPHFDDAWLSLGGTLLQAIGPVTIITLTRHKKGVDTALRVLQARVPHLRYMILDWTSLPIYRLAIYRLFLRYWAFSPERLFLRLNHLKSFDALLDEIKLAVDPSGSCLFPRGLWHPMHWVAASLGRRTGSWQARIGYYLDLPYGVYQSMQPDRRLSEAHLVEDVIPIQEQLNDKISLIRQAYPWAVKYFALRGMRQAVDQINAETIYFGGHPCRPKRFSYTLCRFRNTRTGC